MSAADLYRAMCEYVACHDFKREEPGSGWWWNQNGDEMLIGGAVVECLHKDGIDMREEPA